MRQAFGEVDTWIFDIDNTLYPPHVDLFPQIDEKMGAFIGRLLDLGRDEARVLQKKYYRDYGTTLRGLMSEHSVNPHDFLAFVHDIDHSPLEPDPALGAALAELPGRKLILTNGSRDHADAVLDRLGIAEHFDDLFDIIAANFMPKPEKRTYEAFIEAHGVAPGQAAMFEDMSRNLEVPHALGMRTVLVTPAESDQPSHRAEWEVSGRSATHVDHVTDDLADFLITIAEALTAKQ